ncbi:MAG: O-antigen ligase family protein [Aggregatilineales bacterium]
MLEVLQLALWATVAALGIISSPRLSLYQAFEGLNIPLDFQAVTLAYADLFAVLLVLASGLRALAENDYRLRLSETFSALLRRPYAAFFAIFLVVMGLGILWARQPGLLIATTVHFAICALLSVIGADLVRAHGIGILWPIALGGAGQAIIGILQVLRNDALGLSALGEVSRLYYEPDVFFRASGLSMHPNYLGGYLMLAIFATLCLAWQAHGRLTRTLSIALGILCTFGMIGTLSRSALLATVCGLLPLIWLAWRSMSKRARRTALSLAGVGSVAALAFTLVAVRGDVATRFLSGREFFFADSWAVIQEAPLLGVGAGNLMHQVWLNVGTTLEPKLPVHNVYLYIWAETGLLGLAIFGMALALNLWRLQARYGAAHLILGCAVLALAVVSLFDNYTWAVHPHRVLTFWWLGIWWGAAWLPKDIRHSNKLES